MSVAPRCFARATLQGCFLLVGSVRYNDHMDVTLDGEHFELTPELVRARLVDQVPGDIHEYWVEVDGVRWPVKQVISLATGVSDRQRSQSQSSRRWLQKLGFSIGGGKAAATAGAAGHRRSVPPWSLSAASALAPARPANVVLVGCVKTKVGHGAPAKDLYVSDYFAKMRAYAEASGLPWFILSAEHGLVSPDEWLEPYERYLPGNRVTTDERGERRWPANWRSPWAHSQAPSSMSTLARPTLSRLKTQLRVAVPSSSTSSGAFHSADGCPGTSSTTQPTRRAGLRSLLSSGTASPRCCSPTCWPAERISAYPGCTAGGSMALEHQTSRRGWVTASSLASSTRVSQERATRSGGGASANTLWGRIATMHLGKKHEFSTLRRSLGSILAEATGQVTIDEVQLTRWIHAHLRVISVPVADVGTLDRLESDVLAALDPPLNLAKVPKTPLRLQLSVLRKKYAGQTTGDRRLDRGSGNSGE